MKMVYQLQAPYVDLRITVLNSVAYGWVIARPFLDNRLC